MIRAIATFTSAALSAARSATLTVTLTAALTATLTVTLASTPTAAAGREADQRIDGAAAQDAAGWSMAPIGDVNGDDLDDYVIGAPRADYLGRADAGTVYVIFGTDKPAPTVDLNTLGSRGFVIGGAAPGDQAGTAVAAAEDVNDDGLDDIVIGAPHASANSRSQSGSVFVVYGSDSNAGVDLANPGARAVRIDGAQAGDQLGSSVTGPGDMNGDGWMDIAASALGTADAGAVWVRLGPLPASTDLAAPGAFCRIDGAVPGDHAGKSLARAGDLNGDGRDDLLIGAPDAGFNARPSSGATYVVYGQAAPATVSLNNLGTAGYRIDGAAATDGSGTALGVGDINDDDLLDILIGAPNADNNARNDSGSVYAVFGTPTPGPVDLAALGSGGIRVDGAAPNGLFGWSVAALDLDGDSIDDLVGGAPSAAAKGRAQSGSVYAVSGGPSVAGRDLGVTAAQWQFDGAAAGDRAGLALASVGDVNDDAGEDLLIGAPAAGNNGRPGSGSAYVVFGDLFGDDPLPESARPAAAKLRVKARKASKPLPRTGKVRLIRRVSVGSGQNARIDVKVKPKRTRHKLKVSKTRASVTVRTRQAPRGRVSVKITSSGPSFTPAKWTRTWRIR